MKIFVILYLLFSVASLIFFNFDWSVVTVVAVVFFISIVFYYGFKDSFKSDMKTIRLNETGELVQATVLSIKQTNIYNGEDPEVIMAIRVQEVNGSSYQATVRGTVKLVDIPAYQPGKQIEVVRDRQDRYQVVLKDPDFEKTQELHRKLREIKKAKLDKKMAGQVK
jgi:K+ transporter